MFTQLTARYDHFYDRKDYAGEASEGRAVRGRARHGESS